MTPLRASIAIAVVASMVMQAPLASTGTQRSFRLDIASGVVPKEQRTMRVGKGDEVLLAIRTDAPGEVHVHGYRLTVKVTPGTESRLQFKAFATGRYAFEWHGVESGHANRGHHAPALSVLEVHPR